LLDRHGWDEKPLPERYAVPKGSRVRIYFGRDNRPRLMGTSAVSDDGSGTEAIYLRLKRAGWRREPSEIGRLGGRPRAGLYGVLGHEDPEVVCKPGDACIVKRRTGWTTLPSGPGMPRVFMHGGHVWALHPTHVAELGSKGWTKLQPEPPWEDPTGLWGNGPGAVWVTVAHEDAIYRYESGQWARLPCPVRGPRGLWGRSASDVWVVGTDGAAHFDGTSWRKVAGPEGPLIVVQGGFAEDVWLGGPSGLWHGTPLPDA